MPNIRLTLEYDGARYHGWQRQPGRDTIQGALEDAIRKVSGEKVNVIGAGRTDAGVHALGQAAHFKTRSRLSPEVWIRALNRHLPDDITVRRAERAPDSFHARFDAVEKIYEYRILNRRLRSAVGRQYRWTVHPPLDVSRMRRAARLLRGRHDFSAFRAGGAHPSVKTSVCSIKNIRILKEGDELRFILTADRFLHQMVRTIVGTLVEMGGKKRTPGEVAEILASGDRGRAGQTAPPHGLFLMKVIY